MIEGTLVERMSRSRYYSRIFDNSRSSIDTLMGLLADDESRDVLTSILNSYTTTEYPRSYYWEKAVHAPCVMPHFVDEDGYQVMGTANPYYLDDIFELTSDMVLLDGGAYVGDTIRDLFNILGGPCKYVYAFEPNSINMIKVKKVVEQYPERIVALPYGLGDHKAEVRFKMDDAGSRVSSEGDSIINLIDAGSFVDSLKENIPTFIKLDIEGNEPQALNSMKSFIQKNSPDLAISIYHKLEDLWEIPLLIHSINSKYKIYIRHQSNYYTETVCYATVGE